MATIYEVSKLAGVSLATVSRVMNNNAKVSEKTRDKVLAAMKELGYRPNTIAQSLASNRSNSVGILVSEVHGYFYSVMLGGIEAELRRAGKHVIIAAGHSKEAEEVDGIEFLINRSCDALILHVEAVSDEYLVELSKGDTPVVLLNRYVDAIESNCITLNNEKGGYLATKALLDAGHKNVAYISGPLWKRDAQDRLHGHQRALAECGVEFNQQLFFEGDYQESGGGNGMRYLLSCEQPFTALVCANDEMASGAMSVSRAHGIELPKQLSIVGFDNVVFARHLYPRLSTVEYPVREMGKMAARWVLKNFYEDNKISVQNLFEPRFIARDSIHFED